MKTILATLFLLLVVGAAPVAAQTCTLPSTATDVDNPSGVQFCPSADHATVDSYELDILRPDGSVLQTINIGKPAVSATDGSCTAAVNVQPVAFANGYSMRIRAKAGTASSSNVVAINKFNRVPGGPSKLIVK
jgi:hypothetical protein